MRTDHKRGGQGGGPAVDYDHVTAVHPTLDGAVKHLKKELGPHFQEESGATSQKTGATRSKGGTDGGRSPSPHFAQLRRESAWN